MGEAGDRDAGLAALIEALRRLIDRAEWAAAEAAAGHTVRTRVAVLVRKSLAEVAGAVAGINPLDFCGGESHNLARVEDLRPRWPIPEGMTYRCRDPDGTSGIREAGPRSPIPEGKEYIIFPYTEPTDAGEALLLLHQTIDPILARSGFALSTAEDPPRWVDPLGPGNGATLTPEERGELQAALTGLLARQRQESASAPGEMVPARPIGAGGPKAPERPEPVATYGPVALYGELSEVYLFGRPRGTFNDARYRLLEALVRAGDEGLGRALMEEAVPSARRIIRNLKLEDADWCDVLETPGQDRKSRPTYRINAAAVDHRG